MIVYYFNLPSTYAQQKTFDKYSYCALTKVWSTESPENELTKIKGKAEIQFFGYRREYNSSKETYYRVQEIEIEMFYGDYLQEMNLKDSRQNREAALVRASEIAFFKTLDFLGNQGYEVVGDSFQNLYFQNPINDSFFKKAIYFKKRGN